MQHLSEQEQVRREKLDKIKALGIEPYPASLYPIDSTAKEIKQHFEDQKPVCITGRLMGFRVMGKASFAVLQDYHRKNPVVYFQG